MSSILHIALSFLFISTVATAAVPVTPPPSTAVPAKAVPKNVGVTPVERITITIEDITVIDHGTSMSWYTKTLNRGGPIDKDQLEIRAYQILGSRTLGDAGPAITSVAPMSKGARSTFARQNWVRVYDAVQLKVEIIDKKTSQIFSKTVNLPQPAGPAATQTATTQSSGAVSQIKDMSSAQFTDPQQVIEVEDAVYRGRGAYKIRLKNVGNRGIGPQQLSLRPFYHVKNRPPVVGTITTNPSSILANSWKWVNSDGGGIYASGMAECFLLEKVVIEIKNPLTGQVLEHTIPVEKPQGEIVDVNMYLSRLTYTVKNTGTYRSKFLIRMLSFGLYHDKYDLITTLNDLFYTTVILDPGETKSVSMDPTQVNAELKARRPSLKNTFYGADNFMVELYTEYESNYCQSNRPLVVNQANLNRHVGVGMGEEIMISD